MRNILVHNYGYGKENSNRPSFRGRLNVAAAEVLKKRGGADRFIVAGGKIFGDKFPPVGGVTGKELKRKLHLDEKTLTVATTMEDPKLGTMQIKSSAREVAFYLQQIEPNNEAVSIASWVHTFSIRQHYQHQGISNPAVLSAEQILLSTPHAKRWAGIILKMYFSKEQLLLTAQEIVKNLILLHPQGEDWLRAKADNMAQKPKLD
ncbi:MAG: hypothetical protein AAB838_02880 [Patescibacteria group bacterium]